MFKLTEQQLKELLVEAYNDGYHDHECCGEEAAEGNADALIKRHKEQN